MPNHRASPYAVATPGTHAFVVDASRLAPGVYTAVARLDGEAESVRFTLTR